MSLSKINVIIKDKLHMDKGIKETFPIKPMVLFGSARKLSSLRVETKRFFNERKLGSQRCNKRRCQICVCVNKTHTFSSSVTQKTYKINYKLTCDDKCLIYIVRNVLNMFKMQYIGEITVLVNLKEEMIVSKCIYMNIFLYLSTLVLLRCLHNLDRQNRPF